MLEAFTLHFSFKSKLKWMPCLLLSLLPLIAEEEWDVLGASLRDFFIVFFSALDDRLWVYAFFHLECSGADCLVHSTPNK